MNKKRFILKTAFWSAVSAAMYFPAAEMTTLYLYYRKDPDIEAYVQNNLEKNIEEQEEKIGITYPTERPKIEYLIPEEYPSFGLAGLYGLYHNGKDTIYLPSGVLIKPEPDFSDFITKIATFNHTVDVKRTLDHELAHFYCDKMKEKALGKNHHAFQKYFSFPEEIIADQLINEGIAKYFENKMNGEDKKKFSFEEWPSEIDQFSGRVLYQGGYAIVKPIIDRHKEKGIQFLLFNPPTPTELFTPQEYQERILIDIAKLK
ncbi:MAG: hypothetical protein Q8R47_04780 [Nanoarchaeota archaeon]|nr:hypothetical protein [Nanoarchaeota archaeon]